MDMLAKELQEYVKSKGAKGGKILAVLNKNRSLVNALSTPLGQELMKDIIEYANFSLNAFVKMDIDKSNEKWMEARSDYLSAVKMVNRFMDKINKFQSDLEKLGGNNGR